MIERLSILVRKEYKLYLRNREFFIGILIFNALLTVLVSALFRNLQISVNEIGLIASPYLWIILVLGVFRIMLQNLSEESRKLLFLKQTRDGFKSTEIFLAKLISGTMVSIFIVLIQSFVFIILMGFPAIMFSLFKLGLIYILALPALVSLSIIGATISHRSSYEEVLMPIILLPLILLLSVASVTLGESVFAGQDFDYGSFWFKLLAGLQVLLVLTSELLFRVIAKLKV